MCGILGLLLHDPTIDAAPEIGEGLSLLQHRGQDACGMVTCGPKGRFYQCKANGMVRDVFDANAIARLVGGMGVGHGIFRSTLIFSLDLDLTKYDCPVRYPTAGSFQNAEAQPFYVNSPYGIVLAHVRMRNVRLSVVLHRAKSHAPAEWESDQHRNPPRFSG